MSDPKEIFLQPACCASEDYGRVWCEHDAPADCEDGFKWARYVRADLAFVAPEGYALIKLDSVLVPKGEPMPQTIEAWQYLGHQYEKAMLEQRDEIARLKIKINKLEQRK